jgi:hypothetical protein
MWKLTLGYSNSSFLPPHLLSAWYFVIHFKAEPISLIVHKKVQLRVVSQFELNSISVRQFLLFQKKEPADIRGVSTINAWQTIFKTNQRTMILQKSKKLP